MTNLARATIIITRVQEGFKAPLLSLLLPTDGECVFFGLKGQADGRVDLFLRCGEMGFLCTRQSVWALRCLCWALYVDVSHIDQRILGLQKLARSCKILLLEIYQSLGIYLTKLKDLEKINLSKIISNL